MVSLCTILGSQFASKKALDVISKLPDSASIDDIMYQLYVLDKIRKGQEAVKDGKTISVEELKKEMKSW